MPRHKNYIYTEDSSGSVKGQKGPIGPQGEKGRKGSQGLEGRPGKNGRTSTIVGSFYNADPRSLPKNGCLPVGWDDGTNPPVPFHLEVGESLIDLKTSELWCFTPGSNVSNWTKLGKIAGPAGQDGKNGGQGPRGVIGQKGDAGLDGSNGEKGDKGRQGIPGVVGDKGAKGQQGLTGLQGTQGRDGAKGERGEVGEIGYDGDDGAKGQKGETGSRGQRGEEGKVGPQGKRGLKGDSAPPNLVPVAAGCFDTGSWDILDGFNIQTIRRSNSTNCHVILKNGTLGGKPATVMVSGPMGTHCTGTNGDSISIKHRADMPGQVSFLVYLFSS